VILTALCGHGHLDLTSYGQYLAGQMSDASFTDEELAAALATVPALT
jgi:tryptophan synthase beta chain